MVGRLDTINTLATGTARLAQSLILLSE
jgi:hypothetical protein